MINSWVESLKKKTLIIMPAFNEADNIAQSLLAARQAVPAAEILVIDDGSTDETAAIAAGLGFKVVSHPFNCSLGCAEVTGFQYALENKYELIVRLDADGQHLPEEIRKIAGPVLAGEADLVIGSRQDYRFPPARKIGSFIFSRLVKRLCGQKFNDCTSGFRAFNLAAAKFLANNYSDDYAEVDSIITLARAGYRVRETPVVMRPRTGGKSYLTLWKSLVYMLKVTLNILIRGGANK